MPCKNIISWTAMLTAYAENGAMAEARRMFDEMPKRNTASWNAMITAYLRNNVRINEACQLFAMMPERNSVSYAAMISGFLRAGMIDKAQKLYSEMPGSWRDPVCSNALISGYLKMGELEEAVRVFEGMVERDVVSWSSMIDGYCKKARIEEARELFERMPKRNVITWTTMINGCMKKGCFEDGFELFMRMRREAFVNVNSNTLTIMFEACGSFVRYDEGIQMHGLVLHVGFEFDVFLGNSVINMYCRFGCMEAANKAFNYMSQRDVVSWNSLITGYVRNDETEQAYIFFEKMPVKDIVSWTTMITGFSAEGSTGKSIQLFNMMPEKDDIAWTAVISGLVSNGQYEESICWFIQMIQKAIRPNPLTLSSILSATADLVALNQGLQFHAYALKMGMEYDLSIQNSLVAMYSKCGSIADAYDIFRNISLPNNISYNSMISGFSQNGFAEEALMLFGKMQNDGLDPNQITFLSVLSACAHMGLVDEGRNYFKYMRSTYHIEPMADHYACMVDLLGRAGLLDEANDLIHSMPFEPHSGVWGALLAASRIHLRLDLANLAAKHLFELQPHNATPYVVLSSLYSAAGRKKDGEQVRTAKKLKGIRKNPGCSWIVIKDKVHLFLVGDQSHLGFKEIKATLLMIAEEMR
ncbi:pentatricopeptide repeat-containing protein At1g53600, mitochondrial isoform X1 [Malania oleifera]|nr:pentatricopeptide repeat-containing protein At1g53600, mitochondrial isoform X1 [Malania oleifera]XP_057949477.1 pentatricopeptide repeat-containing protein At1g53600, mitochondrial isoform X1 [Malania oleifera]